MSTAKSDNPTAITDQLIQITSVEILESLRPIFPRLLNLLSSREISMNPLARDIFIRPYTSMLLHQHTYKMFCVISSKLDLILSISLLSQHL